MCLAEGEGEAYLREGGVGNAEVHDAFKIKGLEGAFAIDFGRERFGDGGVQRFAIGGGGDACSAAGGSAEWGGRGGSRSGGFTFVDSGCYQRCACFDVGAEFVFDLVEHAAGFVLLAELHALFRGCDPVLKVS